MTKYSKTYRYLNPTYCIEPKKELAFTLTWSAIMAFYAIINLIK